MTSEEGNMNFGVSNDFWRDIRFLYVDACKGRKMRMKRKGGWRGETSPERALRATNLVSKFISFITHAPHNESVSRGIGVEVEAHVYASFTREVIILAREHNALKYFKTACTLPQKNEEYARQQ